MAFKKTTDMFTFESILTEPKNTENTKISIPLVFTKENSQFHGFVPGIVMQDVIENDLELCKTNLLQQIKIILKNRISNKLPFPFFPTNEDIKKDFKNVVLIKRISIQL